MARQGISQYKTRAPGCLALSIMGGQRTPRLTSPVSEAVRGARSGFGLCCGAHDSSHILRREEVRDGHGPSHGSEEAIRLLLILAQGSEELLHFRRRRLQGGELLGELVHRHRCLVALPLVVG